MPFKSEKQRKWMHANKPKMAKKWEKEEKSVEEDRDYKDEYKKFQSSKKAKKYRAELNKYNRQKGTYGNNDGKDASHKGGKIVGFESQSKNRGRSEKSRLKKEEIMNWLGGYDDEFKFKKGQLIKDINPNCPHHGSEGVVTKVTKDEVTYTVRNNGRTYKVGDELTKTKDQLAPLSVEFVTEAVNFSKISTSKLVKTYKQMADKRLSGSSALTFRLIAKELIKRKAKLEGGKDCCDNCKEGKVCCDVHEAISKDEWAQYPKYARKLKPYMKKLLKVPVRVRVIKQANHNPWIEVRVARFGKDIIPNDFRKKALKVTGGGRPRDMDNITYGNITAGSISMKHDQWVKLLGNKVKSESINEANASVIRKKLLKQFGDDPLYKDFIIAKTPKDQKKALKTLKSIRGFNAVRLMQKYVKKLQGESIKGKLRNVIRQEIKSINEIKTKDSKGKPIKPGELYYFTFIGAGRHKKPKVVKVIRNDAKGIVYHDFGDNSKYTIPMSLIKRKKMGGYFTLHESINEGFGSAELMDAKDLAKFEKTRQKNAEVLGYKLTGKSDIKPIKEKSKVTK